MRTIVNRSIALAAAATLTLALTACSGSDDKKEDSPTDNPGATVEATDTATATDDTEATSTAEAGEEVIDPASSEACGTLSKDDITAISGVDFSAAEPVVDSDGACTWDLTSTGGLAMASVMIDESEAGMYTMTREMAAGMFTDVTDLEIAGADQAFSYMGGWIVAMEVGDKFVQVIWMSFTDTAEADTTIGAKLAEKVASNL